MIILYLRSKKCYDTIYFCLCHVCINLCSLHNAQCLLAALSIRVLRKTWLSPYKKTKDGLTTFTPFLPTSLTMIIDKDTKNVLMCDMHQLTWLNRFGYITCSSSILITSDCAFSLHFIQGLDFGDGQHEEAARDIQFDNQIWGWTHY